MFEGLKKKFSNFIESISKKEEQEVKKEEKEEKIEPVAETVSITDVTVVQKVEERIEPVKPAYVEEEKEPIKTEVAHKVEHKKEEPAKPEHIHKSVEPPPVARQVKKEEPVRKEFIEEGKPLPKKEEPVHLREPMFKEETKPHIPEQKVTLGTRLKGIIFREVKVNQKDIEPFVEQLKIALLQSDVNYDVTEKIIQNLQTDLTSRPIGAKDLSQNITSIIRESILKVLKARSETDLVTIVKRTRAETGEPFRILFLGPNGAGKTTTMAKIAKLLMNNGMTCVMSASDTFRAAAIEQTVHHAGKLGIHVIKGVYGADPASVAFDAVAYAKAHGIDAVLIDSAGRQETNKSLMEEIKKMVRVAKPDMKIFIGESIVGNALLNQVKEFNQAVKLDGIILTKLDADAKGGNTLSILSETEVPVLFFTTGEGYEQIMPYSPEFIIDNLVPNN